MVLTLGGFYPGFRPEPSTLPPLKRIALALRSPLPLPLTLRAEAYFAVTSNTLQLGVHIDASFNAGLSAVGSFGLDALIQFRPFHFHADFAIPSNSTFTLFASPAAAGFTLLCPVTRACVPAIATPTFSPPSALNGPGASTNVTRSMAVSRSAS